MADQKLKELKEDGSGVHPDKQAESDDDCRSEDSETLHYEVISPDSKSSSSNVRVLTDGDQKPIWEMSAREMLDYAAQKKESGGAAYNGKQFDDALSIYQHAIDALESSAGFDGDEDLLRRRSELLSALRCNAAQCLLKLNRYADAERFCDAVLHLEPRNEKALFRRGVARFERNADGDLAAARHDFESCLCVDSSNRTAVYYRDMCEKRVREQLKQDKRLFGSIFNKLSVELNLEEAESKRQEQLATDPFSNVSVWDNKMADAFISLEQEMEAFGECVPRVKSVAEIRRDGADDMSDDSEADEQEEPSATRVKGSN